MHDTTKPSSNLVRPLCVVDELPQQPTTQQPAWSRVLVALDRRASDWLDHHAHALAQGWLVVATLLYVAVGTSVLVWLFA